MIDNSGKKRVRYRTSTASKTNAVRCRYCSHAFAQDDKGFWCEITGGTWSFNSSWNNWKLPKSCGCFDRDWLDVLPEKEEDIKVHRLLKRSEPKCPFCGGEGELVKLEQQYPKYSNGRSQVAGKVPTEYWVSCVKCLAHSEKAKTQKQALQNWRGRNFSQVQRMLGRPLKNSSEEGMESLREAVFKTLRKDYCAVYASGDRAKLKAMDREVAECCAVWGIGAAPDDIIKALRKYAKDRFR